MCEDSNEVFVGAKCERANDTAQVWEYITVVMQFLNLKLKELNFVKADLVQSALVSYGNIGYIGIDRASANEYEQI